MEENFTYSQLRTSKPGSFRILKLQPGEKEAPIVCNLIHTRLDIGPPRRWRRWKVWKRPPEYEAISYVWGSPDRPISIDCDGKRLYITENLRDALVRVRLPHRPRSIWADSICIDQDNLDEKGHQVQFMSKIFSNASRVLICLGEDDEGHARKAMSLVKDVSNMVAKTLPECEQTYDSFPYLAPNDPWLYDDRWPAYNSMISRPWFRRGWVLQEAALAQDAVVLWGEAECRWIPLMDAVTWIHTRGQTFRDQQYYSGVIQIILHLSVGADTIRLQPLTVEESASENLGVPRFMEAARALTLSNPVDRVLAFLAILDEFSQCALDIKVDYSKTPESVYTEFAVAYLQATRDLNLLQCVQHTNESIELGTPSWVPLWNIDAWVSVHDTILARQQYSKAHFTLEQGSGTPRLAVQALLFDTIRFASDPLILKTVEDVAELWQIIRHIDESADVSEFLQVMCWGRFIGDWEAWALQISAYSRHLLDGSSSSNLGMKTFFKTYMICPQDAD